MKFVAVTDNHLYQKAYRSGSRKSSNTVTVYVMKDKSAGWLRKKHPLKIKINRIGISASKKVGGAVQRNRAKRVIREAYREIDKTLGIKKGYIVIIVPKPACTVCSMKDCLRDLSYCLRSLEMTEKGKAQKNGSTSDKTSNAADEAVSREKKQTSPEKSDV